MKHASMTSASIGSHSLNGRRGRTGLDEIGPEGLVLALQRPLRFEEEACLGRSSITRSDIHDIGRLFGSLPAGKQPP